MSVQVDNRDRAPSVVSLVTVRTEDTMSSARLPTKWKAQDLALAVGPPPPHASVAIQEHMSPDHENAPISSSSLHLNNNIFELDARESLQPSDTSELSGSRIHELANGGTSPTKYIAYNPR